MILRPGHSLSLVAAAVLFTACAAPAGDAPGDRAHVDTAEPVAAAPTAATLLELDRQANEAFLRGDGDFFGSLLGDSFVMLEGGSRVGKTDVVERIRAARCEVAEGWSVTEPQMSKIDDDTYVLIYKMTMDGSCTVDGKTEPVPSPVRAATVWVRSGEGWQAVFHGENLIVDPTAPPTAEEKGPPEKGVEAAAIAEPAADPLTDALMAVERPLWEAWRTHDAVKIEERTAGEISFVNIFGTSFGDKAAAIEDWTSAACDVTSVELTNGVGTSVSPTVAILTLEGTVEGTCGAQDISGQVIHGTTVYVKEGADWKWVFGFNSP
jgi:hypothetical protein